MLLSLQLQYIPVTDKHFILEAIPSVYGRLEHLAVMITDND